MFFNHDQDLAWTEAERAAWAPPEDITVSQWAERHRVLPKQSARPGPWNNRLAPYTVGVMDAFNDPIVERLTIMASVQSAKTESAYNMLGYAISQDPAPALVVMPTDKTLKRVNKRIQDMIVEGPELSRYLTGNRDDLQKRLIVLRRMEIHFATAGSKSDLANVEARYILLDEPDRYPLEDDEEGSPIERAEARATTYWNRKIIETCTPTIPEGHINVEFQRSDKRYYWVPCPHCGGYQVLIFRQVKHQGEILGGWPEHLRDPEYIKRERVARYECLYCLAEIDDADKAGMLARGKWVPEGHHLDRDGGEGEAGDPGMTEQVYQWLRLNGRGRIYGVKGHARALVGGKKMQESRIDKFPGGRPIPGGLRLYLLDTNALKDAFWSRVETGRVHLHAGTGAVFAAHLSAEAKERNKKGKLLWMQQGKKPNHLLDTAIYATAMADPECGGGVMVLAPPRPAPKPDRLEINPITGKPVGTWLK